MCLIIDDQCGTVVSEVSYQLMIEHKFPPEKWPYLAVGLRLAELVPTIEADRGGATAVSHHSLDQRP